MAPENASTSAEAEPQQQPRTADSAQQDGEADVDVKRRLPPYLDHFNARDLKVLFRCWVAAWVACLLIFISPSLRSLGFGTFFAW